MTVQSAPDREEEFAIFNHLESVVRSYARSFPVVFAKARAVQLFARWDSLSRLSHGLLEFKLWAQSHFWRTDSLAASVRERGNLLKCRLEQIVQKYGPGRASAKGRGMMRGIDLKSGEVAGQVISTAFQRGLIVETAGPKDEVVKCLPPLVIGEDQLSQGLDIFEDAIESVIGSNVNTGA